MEFLPTPIDRLLALEAAVERLYINEADLNVSSRNEIPQRSHAIWQADELLLTRLIRRSPVALHAYLIPAELTLTDNGGIILVTSHHNSPFFFCEINDGDALLCFDFNLFDKVKNLEIFHCVFDRPESCESTDLLAIQRLALFKPIVRGEKWTMHRKGELVLRSINIPEQTQNMNILTRLDELERNLSRLNSVYYTEIRDLRTIILTHEQQLSALMRISR
jgi:hypothetical protein